MILFLTRLALKNFGDGRKRLERFSELYKERGIGRRMNTLYSMHLRCCDGGVEAREGGAAGRIRGWGLQVQARLGEDKLGVSGDVGARPGGGGTGRIGQREIDVGEADIGEWVTSDS